MFKLLLTPLAAASLLCAGCSQLNPFSGDSDENPGATASWNQSSETDSSWNQEEPSNPTASTSHNGNNESTSAFGLAAGSDEDSAAYGFATAEEASASPYSFNGNDPAAELYSRVEALQTANSALTTEVNQLNKQFSALLAACNTNTKLAQGTNAFMENASSQIESFGSTLAAFDAQISSIAAEATATRSEIRELGTDVRNVSNSTTANLTPVIENGFGSNGNWFKITLAALVIGFAAISYFCWKAFSGNRGTTPSNY
jgi:prefoldin subunit 5